MSQNNRTEEFPIPHDYLWMTEGYENRGSLFKGYVEAYIEKTYPEYQFIKIEGMKAICQRR
jgi:hypothetical protein